jgi:hypothetical protein
VSEIAKTINARKLELAKKLRQQCEAVAKDFIDYSDSETLRCMCAICSCALARLFRKNGHTADVVIGRFKYTSETWGDCEGPHCWVESGRKIYDLTATQFGIKEKILISNLSDRRFIKDAVLIDLDRAAYIFSAWPLAQRPLSDRIEKLLTAIT